MIFVKVEVQSRAVMNQPQYVGEGQFIGEERSGRLMNDPVPQPKES
jgi:hypothetical protein